MLEMLLAQYEDQFGEIFPLKDFEGEPEIDLINILYFCLQNSQRYEPGMEIDENHFPEAPGQSR